MKNKMQTIRAGGGGKPGNRMNGFIRRALFLGSLLLMTVLSRETLAQTTTSWDTATSDFWTNSVNWDNGVPSGNTVGMITNSSASFTVTYDSTANNYRALILSNLPANTSTLLITNSSMIVTNLILGANGVIAVNNGGVFNLRNLISNVVGAFIVNTGGTATWVINSTAPDINGVVTVNSNGLFSTLTGNFNLNAGGRVLVESGGVITNANTFNVGRTTSGVMTNRGIVVNNAQNASFIVGFEGVGTLQMEDGLLVVRGTNATGIAVGVTGSGNNANGIFNLIGGTVSNAGRLSVGVSSVSGRNSAGLLNITGGNWVNSSTALVFVGASTSTTLTNFNGNIKGTLQLSGSGAFQTFGNVLVGASSTGTVTVAGGDFVVTNATGTATMSVGSTSFSVTNMGRGTLTLSGGTLTVDRLFATNGSLSSIVNFSNGTLNTKATIINNGSIFTVGNGLSSATLNLQGGNHSFADGLTIANVATLQGTGTITAPVVTVVNGGTLSPGTSPGFLQVDGDLDLMSNSIFTVELDGLIPGTDFDQVAVLGDVSVSNSLLNVLLGFTPNAGDSFLIVSNMGGNAVFGNFGGLLEGSSFTVGASTLQISYVGGDGNDVMLTTVPAIPEPSALLLCLAGLAFGIPRIRRRCSTANTLMEENVK